MFMLAVVPSVAGRLAAASSENPEVVAAGAAIVDLPKVTEETRLVRKRRRHNLAAERSAAAASENPSVVAAGAAIVAPEEDHQEAAGRPAVGVATVAGTSTRSDLACHVIVRTGDIWPWHVGDRVLHRFVWGCASVPCLHSASLACCH